MIYLSFYSMQFIRRSRLPSIKEKTSSNFPEYKREDIELIANKFILDITNAKSRFQLLHGKDFRDFLEARDHVLEH